MNYLRKRTNSFKYAFQGIASSFKDVNMIMHYVAAVVVVASAFYFQVSKTDWCILILCCSSVIVLEMLNTCIERLCDLVEPEVNPRIKFIKDVAAGAVLVGAIGAAVIGIIIFYGYFMSRFS